MFDLRSFIKKELLDMAGRSDDYPIACIAGYWFEKRVLNEADMEELSAAVNVTEKTEEDYNRRDDIPIDVTFDYSAFSLGDPPEEAIGN